MNAASVRRVRVHVPAKDGWPAMVRGVGSVVTCPVCGARLRSRTHAGARAKLAEHQEACEG